LVEYIEASKALYGSVDQPGELNGTKFLLELLS